MVTSTLLTLVVVPAAYSLVETGDLLRPFRLRRSPVALPEKIG
jgi:hypothetical protein